MGDSAHIAFVVNGQTVEARVPPRTTLLRFLRDQLGLRGAKNGCGTKHCGACIVLVDGEPTKTCTLRLTAVAGARIETIEGLALDGSLHPIQSAYLATGAVQCGFCTPAMILATKALLDKHAHPSDDEIREGLRENICRCTGYVKIIDAVKLAALWVEDPSLVPEATDATDHIGMGTSTGDWEGREKACGSLVFADDLYMDGMLHGKILWSAHPHAEILSVDTQATREVKGLHSVFTAADVPGLNLMGVLSPDQPALCGDRVRFVGDAVAVAFAETLKAAEEAIDLVQVTYRELPGVFSVQQALREDAPLLHESGNVCKHLQHEVGDVDAAFAAADLVLEGHFETPAVEHAYLEPEAALAFPGEDGEVVIQAPTQFPFELRRRIADMLAKPEEQVRIVVTPIGGGFGGKADHCIEGLAALGAVLTGRPVKITLTRRESLRATSKRHPYSMDYRVGLDVEGHLLAVDAKLFSDAGPYTGLSPRVIDQACIFSCGPYRAPNARIEGWALFTNNANGGPFRGFGINQAAFSLESLLDEAAIRLGLDPLELRLRNALVVGDQTVSGEILQVSVAIKETIEATRDALAEELPWIQAMRDSGRLIGVGVASGFKNVGAGKGKIDDAGAIFSLESDGRITLRASAVDMGQGIRTALAQVAAEVLSVPAGALTIVTGDTSLTIKHGGGAGERQMLIAGKAVELGAVQFKDLLLDRAAEYTGVAREGLDLRGGMVTGPEGASLRLSDLARHAGERWQKIETSYYYVAPKTYALADSKARTEVPPEEYRNYPAYAYATHVAIVEVDDETSRARVLKMLAAHDCGRAVNPQKIEGQIEGSCMQGIGYALTEEFPVKDGHPQANSFGRLGVPTIMDAPEVVSFIVEDPEPGGPFGAKGVSEVATVPATPAVTNAIYDAVGVRITSLPAKPEVIAAGRAALRTHEEPGERGRK